MIKDFLRISGHKQTSPLKEKSAQLLIEEKTAGSNEQDQVQFTQEEVQKASADMAELKKQLEGKSPDEAKSSIKDFLKNHWEVTALGGLQIANLVAQGANQKELMAKFDELQGKLDPKKLNKLAVDFKSAKLKEYFAEKTEDVDKEIVKKLQSLEKQERLYKATPIRGALKAAAVTTLAALWTAGPLAASIIAHVCGGVEPAIIVGGVVGDTVSNVFGWMFFPEFISGSFFNKPIGAGEALERLDANKSVKILNDRDVFDKIKNMNHLGIIKE